jgi:O-antigen ligase/tetratricopeptide (TPR) repeat protein
MNLDSFLRRSLIVLLCSIPFIPLIIANPLFFPFITGKNFAFRIIVELALLLWAVLALRDPSLRPRWSSLPVLILALLASAGISTILAENPAKAFWSNFERMEGWIGLLHSTAYFFLLWCAFQSEKIWGRFWNTSIVASAVVGIYALFQLSGALTINQGGLRVDSTFGNATYFAVYMLFHAFLTLFFLVRTWSTSSWLRYWYIAVGILQAVMIFYSATRGAILGFVGGLFVTGLALVLFGKGNAALKKWGIGAVITVLVVAGGFIAIKDTPFVQGNDILARIASINLTNAETRFTIWGMAFEGFKERPVFGWGQEGYNYIFNKYYEPTLHSQEPWFDRAHNAFIDWLVAGGAVAFLIYCSFYAVALWLLWRPQSSFSVFERSLFTGLLAAYTFHNLFVFDNLISYFLFMSVLAYIGFRARGADSAPALPGKPVSENIYMVAAPALVIVMAVVFYFANVPGIATAANIIQGLSQHASITENFNYFKEAAKSKGLGRQEVQEQLMQFAIQVRSMKVGDEAFQLEVAQFAADQMTQEINRTPNDARLHVFLGSFARQFGNYELALQELTKAHELSPEKQQIIFELGILEASKGNQAGALEWFKTAYDLDPEYQLARLFYAATAIRMGNKELTSELLMPRFGTVTPDNDYILQAYLDIKDFTSAILIAEARVAKNPNDAQVHIQLAASYLQSGNRDRAIAELEKAIELNSAFKTQGEYYIEQIRQGLNP